MSLVIPKHYSHQGSYKKSQKTPLIIHDYLLKTTSKDVSYSSHNKWYGSGSERFKHQILLVQVNRSSFHRTEATEKGLRESVVEDVSISKTRLLPQQKDVDKSLASPVDYEEDALDWDFYLENPPPKPTATIELELEYGGRSKPIPVTDPWDE